MQRLGAAWLGVAVLLLLASPQLVHGLHPQKVAKPIAQPDYTIYHRKDDLLKEVQSVVSKNAATMQMETKTSEDGDYQVEMLVVTVDPSAGGGDHANKARLLLDFGEHGREFISSEIGLRLLQVLADPAQLMRYAGSARRARRLQRILQNVVLKILPMENTHGRDLVERGNLCERKNGRGVDTNRNWDIDWGKKEKDYDPSEEYPGRAPHSEPEVQVILNLARAFNPHVWLNVHSGMQALFTPYDHKPFVPEGHGAQAALRMLHRINADACKGHCTVGSGGKSVGYLAHGTATDYMYEVLKVPMAFTWEIYGDQAAAFEDCFRMFNPLTQPHFEQTVVAWVSAVLQMIELLPSHPATLPLFKHIEHLPGSEHSRGGHQSEGSGGELGVAGIDSPVVGVQRKQQQEQQQQGAGALAADQQQQLQLLGAAGAGVQAQQQLQPSEAGSVGGSEQAGGTGPEEERTVVIHQPSTSSLLAGQGGSSSSSGTSQLLLPAGSGHGFFRKDRLYPVVLGLGGLLAVVVVVARKSNGQPFNGSLFGVTSPRLSRRPSGVKTGL